ncbi:MAG: hypothetical protein DHS20C21_13310 [Gemmatimonadota bacterium]|nr:MAG: hypothetical protein DHS20C21_13310 [Gemmatimonadota bacterium]
MGRFRIQGEGIGPRNGGRGMVIGDHLRSKKQRVSRLIAPMSDLVPLPQSLSLLRSLLTDPVVEVSKLVPVVEKDTALTAALLRLCNSAQFGLQRKVGSVKEGLVLIGNVPFLKLAISVGMTGIFRPKMPGYGLQKEDLWAHCLATAHAASEIVKGIGHPELEGRAFPAGLLHDVGMIVLDEPLVRHREQGRAVENQETRDMEQDATGVDRDEVGAALVELWKFPEALVNAVRWHHDPQTSRDFGPLVVAVHAGERIARAAGIGADGVTSDDPLESLEDLGIPASIYEDLRDRLPTITRNLQGIV